MIGQQVPAASLAILPLAARRLLEHADLLGAFRDAHGVGLPQRERVDGARRPPAARSAMAIAHAFGFTRDLDLHGAAETFALVSPSLYLFLSAGPHSAGPQLSSIYPRRSKLRYTSLVLRPEDASSQNICFSG